MNSGNYADIPSGFSSTLLSQYGSDMQQGHLSPFLAFQERLTDHHSPAGTKRPNMLDSSLCQAQKPCYWWVIDLEHHGTKHTPTRRDPTSV
jgi:hypothetical protein